MQIELLLWRWLIQCASKHVGHASEFHYVPSKYLNRSLCQTSWFLISLYNSYAKSIGLYRFALYYCKLRLFFKEAKHRKPSRAHINHYFYSIVFICWCIFNCNCLYTRGLSQLWNFYEIQTHNISSNYHLSR